MTFAEKNNFVVRHASEEYFEKDRDLFLKTFPGSPIVKELERAQPFSKKKLDERMLLELLNHYCADTILEQRGIFKSHKKANELKFEEAKKTLIESNIEDLTHEALKDIAKTLSIETPNQKKATLIEALKAFIGPMLEATGTGTGAGAGPVEGDEPGTGEGVEGDEPGTDKVEAAEGAPIDPIKKKESPEQNTPK